MLKLSYRLAEISVAYRIQGTDFSPPQKNSNAHLQFYSSLYNLLLSVQG